MAKTTPRQRKTTGRVMHEYKHGELESGRSGKAGKVKSRKQAIAIALSEAGASKYKSKSKNRKAEKKSERKEARGKTYQQEREGKSHVGARGRRESSKAMGGKNATHTTARGRKAARARTRADGHTKEDLYRKAKARHIEGRSKMSKRQLENALHLH
ncbi:MAG TPA: DUF6496 domain-containing protein [Rhizomicrobium sp.]|jgi:hypothetical protein|nr:DUF6496 domain-containing protein [Rhizomicrobium sp.]